MGNSDPPAAQALVMVDVVLRAAPAGVDKIRRFMTGHQNGFASLEEAAEAVTAYDPDRPRPSDPSDLLRNLRRRNDGRLYWHWDPRMLEVKPSSEPPSRVAALMAVSKRVTVPTLVVAASAATSSMTKGLPRCAASSCSPSSSKCLARGTWWQVSMAPLDVLALQSGWASVFVQRNLALFPIGDLGKIRTNDAFLFQTPEVRFANPVVPRLAYDSFSLDALPGATADLDPLLTSFFKDLYGGGTGKTAADVSMQGLYSYELVAGEPTIPRVRLPISLLTPSPSVVSPDVKPDFITPFATVVDDWRRTNKPTTDGAARIEIELKVFGSIGDAKQPLILVGQLTHDVSGGS